MKIISGLEITFDFEALAAKLFLNEGSAEREEFRQLFERASAVANPKAIFFEAPVIGRDSASLTLENTTFNSKVMARVTTGADTVFPFISTCGTELNELEIAPDDFLAEYWLDTIKEDALAQVNRALRQQIVHEFKLPKIAVIYPSDENVWPISEQTKLFGIFPENPLIIGVELTESLLMIPNKSTSGLMFPTNKDFIACELCDKPNCPNRKCPQNEHLCF